MGKKLLAVAIVIVSLLLLAGCFSAKGDAVKAKKTVNQTIAVKKGIASPYVPSEEKFSAKIKIDGSKKLGRINPLIYGNNVWIENSKIGMPSFPSGDKKIFYEGQMAKFYSYFNLAKETKPASIRMPGGLQANHDDWEQMIGTYEKRPERVASGIKQIAIAGIDEYADMAKSLGAEVIFTVNYALGAEDATKLAEYLKGKAKYYEVGNELNCGLAKGSPLTKSTAKDYAENLAKFSDAMKAADPSIKIGALDDCNKLGAEWFSTVNSIAGKKFDFWIKHAYSPGADGNVRGVTINDAKFSIKTTKYFEESGSYEFEFLAEGKKQFSKAPGFDVLIDKRKIGAITISEFGGLFKNEPSPKFYKIAAEVEKGLHEFEVVSSDVVENNVFLAIHPVVGLLHSGKQDSIDLRDDEKIAGLITAGAITVGRNIEDNKGLFYGKPVFVTEWNTIYSFDECSSKGILKDKPYMCSRNSQLREALNLAEYYHTFIREKEIVDEANFWLLFTEIGNMVVSGSEVKLNPSFYVLKLYANNMLGEEILSEVTAPSYNVGYNTGITMGIVSKSMSVSYISSIASINGNILSLAIINKHTLMDSDVEIEMKNLNVKDSATLYQIYSESLEDSQVAITENTIPAGKNFKITVPRHSINVIRFQLK